MEAGIYNNSIKGCGRGQSRITLNVPEKGTKETRAEYSNNTRTLSGSLKNGVKSIERSDVMNHLGK